MRSLNRYLLLPVLILAVTFTSCKKEEGCMDPKSLNYNPDAKVDDGSCEYGYEVPTTYNFENVDYSGQTQRLGMLTEMVNYMKTANTVGVALNAQKLKDMYANQNAPFTDPELNAATSKQIKNKVFDLDQMLFEEYIDKLVAASQSTTAGSDGVAGVVTSNDGTKKYLMDANGFEYAQIIEKGLMGALIYYQATAVYLSDEKIGPSVDNTNVVAGKGTTMEHHWDEAFGYFGVPKDFPTTAATAYWGKYTMARDQHLQSNTKLMNAFLKGRAAITNKDMAAKVNARTAVRTEWEKVVAATAISYMNKAKADFADDALRNHALSEGMAFIMALKYNPDKKISNQQIDAILNHIGINFYNVTVAGIDAARNELSSIYGMDALKNVL